jgi:hypothetical protein
MRENQREGALTTVGARRVHRRLRFCNVPELIIEYVAACDALHERLDFDDFVSGWIAIEELVVSDSVHEC